MLLSSLIDMNIHKFASVDDFMNVIKQASCFPGKNERREKQTTSVSITFNEKGKLGRRMYVCGQVQCSIY